MARMRWDNVKQRHVMVEAATDARIGSVVPKKNNSSPWDPGPRWGGHANGGRVRRLSRAEIEAMKATPEEIQAAIEKAKGEEIYMRMKLLPNGSN